MTERIRIHYHRLPDNEQIFEQVLLEETGEHVVTFLESAPLSAPVEVAGRIILEAGSPVIWFTYPERWYDIGCFHRADGTFTGWYANILTPVRMNGTRWDTTDLCLDVWVEADGGVAVLDEDDFAHAVVEGWIDTGTAATAREHAETLASAARQGVWPPDSVRRWDLSRVRRLLERRSG